MRVDIASGEDVAARVRAAIGADGGSVVAVIAPIADPLVLALARAAIGPLAMEAAPATRVNAVFRSGTADAAAVDAAVAYLERAVSTTGQILDIA